MGRFVIDGGYVWLEGVIHAGSPKGNGLLTVTFSRLLAPNDVLSESLLQSDTFWAEIFYPCSVTTVMFN